MAEFGCTKPIGAEGVYARGAAQGRREDLTGGGLVRSAGGPWELVKRGRAGDRQLGDERVLGGGEFVEAALKVAEEHEAVSSRLSREVWDLDDITDAAADALNADSEAMMKGGRGRAGSARALACYWMQHHLGRSAIDVAEYLGYWHQR